MSNERMKMSNERMNLNDMAAPEMYLTVGEEVTTLECSNFILEDILRKAGLQTGVEARQMKSELASPAEVLAWSIQAAVVQHCKDRLDRMRDVGERIDVAVGVGKLLRDVERCNTIESLLASFMGVKADDD